jgi:hypothetical protein
MPGDDGGRLGHGSEGCLAASLVAAAGTKALAASLLVGKVCRGVPRYWKMRMPRIARNKKRNSAIMGREVGSTQQSRMTNPTNCGIAHFHALPIPSLTIRASRVLKAGFAAS